MKDMSDYLPGFLDRVTAWYQANSFSTRSVVGVGAENNEWVGSTETGWHDELVLTLALDDGGSERLDASEQESLWHWVINGAPD